MKTERELPVDRKMPEPLAERTTAEVLVQRFIGNEAHQAADLLAVEEPVELQLLYGPENLRKVKSISVTMRTPGHDFELVAGFLLTEGMVRDAGEISQIGYVVGRAAGAETTRPAAGADQRPIGRRCGRPAP